MNPNYQEIECHLNEAWDNHQNSKPDLAFERLHAAVSIMLREFRRVDESARRAGNIASCLANGINPD